MTNQLINVHKLWRHTCLLFILIISYFILIILNFIMINTCIFLPVGLQAYVSVVFSVILISTKSVT